MASEGWEGGGVGGVGGDGVWMDDGRVGCSWVPTCRNTAACNHTAQPNTPAICGIELSEVENGFTHED